MLVPSTEQVLSKYLLNKQACGIILNRDSFMQGWVLCMLLNKQDWVGSKNRIIVYFAPLSLQKLWGLLFLLAWMKSHEGDANFAPTYSFSFSQVQFCSRPEGCSRGTWWRPRLFLLSFFIIYTSSTFTTHWFSFYILPPLGFDGKVS